MSVSNPLLTYGKRVRCAADRVCNGYAVAAGDIGIVTSVGVQVHVQFADEEVVVDPGDVVPYVVPYPRITLSGADEWTDIAVLDAIGFSGPVEIAFLYTMTPEGRPRYPSRSWILHAASRLRCPVAVHICGSGARRQLLECSAELAPLLVHAQRIQINGVVAASDVQLALSLYPSHQIITQHHDGNAGLVSAHADPRHALLVDGSGGTGTSPQSWSRPNHGGHVGFAGGLGPESLVQHLPSIHRIATGSWWVDMEQRLRDETDRFDVRRAAEVVRLFAEFLRA